MEEEAKQNMEKLIAELKYLVKSGTDVEEINQVLDSIAKICKSSDGESIELTAEDIFPPLLKHETEEVIVKTAKTIAEIAMNDAVRQKCTRTDLVKTLLQLLQDDRVNVLAQTSRALANICYDNENGKKCVEENGGLKAILASFERSVAMKDKEGAAFLRNVIAGLMLNFMCDSTALLNEAVQQGIVPMLTSGLEIDAQSSSEAAMHSLLLVLGILNDAGLNFLDEPLTKVLIHILSSDMSLELSELCLELLHGQAEDENSKLHLAKAGVCELLLNLLEKYGPYCTDEKTRPIVKVACNLIVLVLIGDESMGILYNNAEGLVYKKLVSWLDAKDKDLQTLAILAIGNFARNDAHCEAMVAQGIHRSLLRLLRGQPGAADVANIQYQHALLSALRNLAIVPENRRPILDAGLIDVLYPLLEVPTFLVLFKLLGALRVVVHGQQEAAVELGTKPDLIKRVVSWCDTESHPGVQGEANRLIASLIISGRSKEIAELMFTHEAPTHLIKMLSAPYNLMRYEAALALNTLAHFAPERLAPDLLRGGFFQLLPKLMEDSENIAGSVMPLTRLACSSGAFKDAVTKALDTPAFLELCTRVAARQDIDPVLRVEIQMLLLRLDSLE